MSDSSPRPQDLRSLLACINGTAMFSTTEACPIFATTGPGTLGSTAEVVTGDGLAQQVHAFIQRFMVLTAAQLVAVTMWVLHTFVIDAFEVTPYLNIFSAEKGSGKTRLLEILSLIVAHGWQIAGGSPAAMVRKISKESNTTLLLDESDATFGGDKSRAEHLRLILNAGYRRGAVAPLCFGQGANIDVKDYVVFCPKAIAGIGNRLPDTVQDRSVPIGLVRRDRKKEPLERFFLRDQRPLAEKLVSQLQRWGAANVDFLRSARPSIPELNISDRTQEIWEPLLAVADSCGGDWPRRVRWALTELCTGNDSEDESEGVRLLADCKRVIDTLQANDDGGTDRITSKDLLDGLLEPEDSPWREHRKGQALTYVALAAKLRPFDIRPCTKRFGDATFKGYMIAPFADAFGRYLMQNEPQPVTPVTSITRQGFAESLPPEAERHCLGSRNGAKPDEIRNVTDVTRQEHPTKAELTESGWRDADYEAMIPPGCDGPGPFDELIS